MAGRIDQGTLRELQGQNRTTATSISRPIDVNDYEDTIIFIQAASCQGGTTPTLAGKIQHGDTIDGTFSDVTGATFTTHAGATAQSSYEAIKVEAQGLKKWVRHSATLAGTSPDFTYHCMVFGQKKHN